MTKRDLIPRKGRWSLRIQEIDAQIEHRSGNRMEHVDCLSRSPTEPARKLDEATLSVDKVELSNTDWLSTLQISDPKIQTLVNELLKTKDAENEQFPKQLRWKMLHDCHDNAGHLALGNTLRRIKNTMWFERMRKFAKSYISTCIKCSYNKHIRTRNEGEYHYDNIPTIPFNTIHLDHHGPFPKSRSRNERVLELVDAFTKFTIIRPAASTKNKFVLKVINEVKSYFGTPEGIITDRGTAFTSHEFENYCKTHLHAKNTRRVIVLIYPT